MSIKKNIGIGEYSTIHIENRLNEIYTKFEENAFNDLNFCLLPYHIKGIDEESDSIMATYVEYKETRAQCLRECLHYFQTICKRNNIPPSYIYFDS